MTGMYAEERQQVIAELAHQQGRVVVSGLARRFEVSPETIRRDLDALAAMGLLSRVHGGAVPVESVRLVEMGLGDRETTAIEEKLRIGRAALGILPHNSGTTILLDAGTTVARLADILPMGAIQTVVTDSVPIAAGLSARLVADVQLLGGSVRGITQATVGAPTVEALAFIRVDIAFIGTNGFSLGHGLSTPDPGEAAVKRAMVLSARRVIVLADSSKYGADYLVRFASWDQIDTLVTDSALPPEAHRALSDRGIEVVIA